MALALRRVLAVGHVVEGKEALMGIPLRMRGALAKERASPRPATAPAPVSLEQTPKHQRVISNLKNQVMALEAKIAAGREPLVDEITALRRENSRLTGELNKAAYALAQFNQRCRCPR